jgi:hypothetical protein
MGEQTVTFDRGIRDSIMREFQKHQQGNPKIPTVIRKLWGLELAGHDFLAAMWPLFSGLQTVAELLGGELPKISTASFEKAWDELHEAPPDVLDGEEFDQFRHIIEIVFRTALTASVNSADIRLRVERIFAMILRMIQLEQKKDGSE